jgi:hypothetical protein
MVPNVQVLPPEVRVFVVQIIREFGFYILGAVRTTDKIIHSYETDEYGDCG